MHCDLRKAPVQAHCRQPSLDLLLKNSASVTERHLFSRREWLRSLLHLTASLTTESGATEDRIREGGFSHTNQHINTHPLGILGLIVVFSFFSSYGICLLRRLPPLAFRFPFTCLDRRTTFFGRRKQFSAENCHVLSSTSPINSVFNAVFNAVFDARFNAVFNAVVDAVFDAVFNSLFMSVSHS